MANSTIYFSRNALSNSSSGTFGLDGLATASLNDGDVAYVSASGVQYIYVLSAYSGAASNPPYVIIPLDAGTSPKRWIRQQFACSYQVQYVANAISSASDIQETQVASFTIAEYGAYYCSGVTAAGCTGAGLIIWSFIKKGVGGAPYANASYIQSSTAHHQAGISPEYFISNNEYILTCNVGDIIYFGAQVYANGAGTRILYGLDTAGFTKPCAYTIFKVI